MLPFDVDSVTVQPRSQLGVDLTTLPDGIVAYDALSSSIVQGLAESKEIVDHFTYTVRLVNGVEETGEVSVSIVGINDPPIATADAGAGFATSPDVAFVTGNVLANDHDVDQGDVLTIVAVDTAATIGQVIDQGDGTFRYDPRGRFDQLAAGEVFVDTFSYTVADTSNVTSTATVNVRVEAPASNRLFRELQPLGAGGSYGVASGDLDGNGDADAIVVGVAATSNRVYLNDGQGHFKDAGIQLGSATGYHVELADVDDDGDLDAWIAHGQAGTGAPDGLWINDGDGQFHASDQTLGTAASSGVALGDLDGDGDLDAVVADFHPNQPSQIWLNDGTGVFRLSAQSLEIAHTVAVALADLDQDQDLDLVLANQDEPHLVYENDGQGGFTLLSDPLPASSARDLAVADFNGDGWPDIYLVNANPPTGGFQGDQIYLNQGDGSWVDAGLALGHTASSRVAVGDLDLDGDIDALVTNWFNQLNSLWLNQGDGQLRASGNPPLDVAIAAQATLLDMDNDGDLDAIVANVNQPDRVYQNLTIHTNQPPVAHDDLGYATDEDTPLTIPAEQGLLVNDTDADGEFDSSDLVIALQHGGYTAAADRLFARNHE